MENKQSPDKNTKWPVKRRQFVASLTTGAAILGTGIIGSATASGPTSLGSFETNGVERITVDITPEEIAIKRIKTADRIESFGKRRLSTTETYERPAVRKDDYPRKTRISYEQPWTGYIAPREQWVQLARSPNRDQLMFTEEQLENVAEREGVRIESYPDQLPKYYHNNVDGLWELSGPINLLGFRTSFDDASECASNIEDNGDGRLWTTTVADATRYALTGSTFQRHEESVASGPLGITGRTHARLWNGNDGDYVLVAAHEDDNVPHEAVSYLEAEYRIVDFMNSSKDGYDAGNDEKVGLDHNGKVSYIAETNT